MLFRWTININITRPGAMANSKLVTIYLYLGQIGNLLRHPDVCIPASLGGWPIFISFSLSYPPLGQSFVVVVVAR